MAEKLPLCVYGNDLKELQSGDTLPSSGSGLPDTFEGTAGEALSQYDVVYSNSADTGEHWIATNAGTSAQADAVGIVIESGGISDTATGTILRFGPLTNAGWSWTPGATLWLGTDGALTETMPSAGNYAKPLGYAETATKIWFAPQNGWLVGYDIDLTEIPAENDGRITLVSTTQIKWDGHRVTLWDPTKGRDVQVIPSSVPTLDYDDTDLDSNALVAAYPYDLFLEYSSATACTIVAKKWTNATTRAVSPALWHGRYRYDNTTDTGKKRLWIGTVYLATGPIFVDASNKRFIWNKYNQKALQFGMECPYSSTAEQNATTSWVAFLDTAYKSEIVVGDVDTVVSLSGGLLIATGSEWLSAAVGLDGTIPAAGSNSGASYVSTSCFIGYRDTPGIGYHYLLPYIKGASTTYVARAYYSASGCEARFSLLGEVSM